MLYRIDPLQAKGEDDFKIACEMEDWLHDHGVLVPVEPCEHGNYDRHAIVKEWLYSIDGWCVGAALKEGTRSHHFTYDADGNISGSISNPKDGA